MASLSPTLPTCAAGKALAWPAPARGAFSAGRRVAAALGALLLLGQPVLSQAPAATQDRDLGPVLEAAHAGQVAQARHLLDPVLQAHPDSAKAHFIDAQLLARQGLWGPSQDELAAAERLAPGLPFATPQAVGALRSQLAALGVNTTRSPDRPPAAAGHVHSWRILLAMAAGALMAWLLGQGRPSGPPRPPPTVAEEPESAAKRR